MKPLKLSIQAFGPFAGEEIVDFTRLGASPLFLINGPTGAGKSSILDAICFALYGQTTGNERDGSQMRCDHADLNVITEVSLEFALADKKYLIRRVPMQERAKKNGDGTTTQPAEAQLRELDGSADGRLIVSKSIVEANTEIKVLIGLGVEQFRQVMVLPQGKFRELLLADSKDREAIFSQLFETHIYKKIENRLKEKASTIKQAVERHHSEIRGILQAAELNSEDDIRDELDVLTVIETEQKVVLASAAALLAKSNEEKNQAVELNKRFDILAKKGVELESIRLEAKSISGKESRIHNAAAAQKIYHLYASNVKEAKNRLQVQKLLEGAQAQHRIAEIAHADALQNFDVAKEASLQLDDLKANKGALDNYKLLVDRLIALKNDFTLSDVAVKKSESALEQKNRAVNLRSTEISNYENQHTQLFKELEQHGDAKLALERISSTLASRNELEAVSAKQKKAISLLAQQRDVFTDKTILFENAQLTTKRTDMAWHTGQAALLAAELKEGEPCPVCGSDEHPLPAKQSDHAEMVSKNQLDSVRVLEDRAREAMQASKDAYNRTASELQSINETIDKLVTTLKHYTEMAVEEVKEEAATAQKLLSELDRKQQERAQLTLQVTDIKSLQHDDVAEFESIKKDAQRKREASLAIQVSRDQLLIQVPEPYRVAGALERERASVTAQVQSLTENLDRADTEYKKEKSNLDGIAASVETRLSQAKTQELLAHEVLHAWQKALSESVFDSEANFQAASLAEQDLIQINDYVKRYHDQLNSLNGVIKQQKQELDGRQRADLDAIEIKLSKHTEGNLLADNAWRKIQSRVNSLKGYQQKLIKAHEVNAELEKQYAVTGTLNDVANGATGNKVSLQRFVLSVLLDDVLIQASQRLKLMSKGRYQLVRKEDRSKGNKASGLELEVEDGDTGKPRSVATLSGGESFMAALSLALGLSDVVQSYAGGIKLETLFIDEGFGSLDMESLDAAIQVLIDLQSTGRTIGIISHVTELKEQMALRIDVTRGATGSSIQTVAA
jgi:exonuclease SbcC